MYNTENGHVYKVVYDEGPGVTWNQAYVAAAGMSYNGTPGYLVTITSDAENTFATNRIGADGWIGASDTVHEGDTVFEGDWKWVAGPESGTSFWSGNGATGSAVGGLYSNWNGAGSGAGAEPNDSGSNEDCGQVRFSDGSLGKWNDLDCESLLPAYIVEFGAPGALPVVANTTFQVTVNAPPAIGITNLTPADNSEVNKTDTFSLTFNQLIAPNQGTIRIYNAADDSLIQSFGPFDDIPSYHTTYTYQLSQKLALGSYYIQFDNDRYSSPTANVPGISDKTTWNFMVVDKDGISDAEENAAPNNGDGNNDGIQDSEQVNVASFVDPYTNSYVSLQLADECTVTSVASSKVSETSVKDVAYEYRTGLVDFSADCGTPGFTTSVNLFFYDVNGSSLVARKFNPNTNVYTSINGATLSSSMIDGRSVTTVSYQVTDGGPMDTDGVVNGSIVDPVGLASLNERSLAATGTNMYVLLAISVLTIVGGLGMVTLRHYRRSN